MKNILTAVLIVTAFSVSACGGDSEPSPQATVFVTQSQEPSASSSDFTATEEEYLNDVSDYMTPALYDEPQGDVVQFGYYVCDEFEQGLTVEEIVDLTSGSGITPTDVRVMSAAAAVNFCPDFQDGL